MRSNLSVILSVTELFITEGYVLIEHTHLNSNGAFKINHRVLVGH